MTILLIGLTCRHFLYSRVKNTDVLSAVVVILCASFTIVRDPSCDRPCHGVVGWLVGHIHELWLNSAS